MDLSLTGIAWKLRDLGYLSKPLGERLLDQIPEVPLPDLVARPLIRIDGSYTYVEGSLPLCDLVALLSVVVDRAPGTVFEIGTFNGHTTRLMALNVPNAQIHTVDLPEDFTGTPAEQPSGDGPEKDDWHLIQSRRVGAQYRADPSITNVTQHFGDTAKYPFPAADLFFIDGSHTYSYVRNDTEKAFATGSAKTLLWHDCDRGHPDISRWLLEMIQAGHPVRRIQDTNLAILDLTPRPLSQL